MSRPNFKIIEGATEDIDYESFKKDYMNPFMPKKDIKEKYNLTESKYLRYGKEVFQDTGFKRRKGIRAYDKMTCIREYGDGYYHVDKQKNHQKIYCGTYDSLDKAIKVRDFLVKHNWSSDAIDYCRNGRLV